MTDRHIGHHFKILFDILHAGHLNFLRQAKALGDVLVVAVNSDASARALKGPGRPINSEQDRLALIEALDPVDYTVLFNEETAASVIAQLAPHVYVKGGITMRTYGRRHSASHRRAARHSATSNVLIRDYKYALCCSWFIPRCLIPGGILV